jgi:hypothetical protein
VKLRAGLLLGLCLLAIPVLTERARAQTTPPPPEPPTCSVARDPQLVLQTGRTQGLLLVLDRSKSVVHRWLLPSGTPKADLPLAAGATHFAFLQSRNALVIAHAGSQRVTLRTLADNAMEQSFFVPAQADGEICGLGTTDAQVVLCVNHNQWIVFDDAGERLDDPNAPTLVGTADLTLDPNEPNDPNAPPPPPPPHSFDGMFWDPNSATMFALRTQDAFAEGLSVPIDAEGAVGDVGVVDPDGDAGDTLEDSLELTPSPLGGFITPAGLTFDPDAGEIGFPDPDAPAEPFVVGENVFFVSPPPDDPNSPLPADQCLLDTGDLALSGQRFLHSGLIRTVSFLGKTFVLREAATTPILLQLRLDSGDIDGDLALDENDFFPIDRAAGNRDSDHDGVENADDQMKFDKSGWRDADGDGVDDANDAFPNDPKESVDADGDGVGANADCDDHDKLESFNSDSDTLNGVPLCDRDDAYPFDPLGQLPGDIGTPGTSGSPTDAFSVTVKRGAKLFLFKDASAVTQLGTLTLFDSDEFELCMNPCGPSDLLSGTATPKGKSGKKWVLAFDKASMSKLESKFATAAADIVTNDPADPPSAPLTFVPKSVTSDGTLKRTKSGASLLLNVRFAFQRPERLARGSRGMFVFRANGTPAP